MGEIESFVAECATEIGAQGRDEEFRGLSLDWLIKANSLKYSYHFTALGRPIIQYPQDMVAVQELVWAVKPDLIIETGIAHGGSLILSASALALLDWVEAAEAGTTLDPRASRRRVVGIDIDIRAHNRAAIEAHPMSHMITMIEGSSIAEGIVGQVRDIAKDYRRVLVFLDSNHSHAHVLGELEAYAPLVSDGSYCVVFDTVVEDIPEQQYAGRPWSKGDNAKTAVWQYLRVLNDEGRTASDGKTLQFEIDRAIESKMAVTVAPDGYLRRV